MSFTDAELIAVARVVWPEKRYRSNEPYMLEVARCAVGFRANPSPQVAELCTRLALAHPERAGEALGPGWSVQQGWTRPVIVWQYRAPVASGMGMHVPSSDHPPRIVVGVTGVEATVRHYIPPEFDAALARARLIAAAWKRIEASSKRDPARPYCREPETCGGSCRRDPACCE